MAAKKKLNTKGAGWEPSERDLNIILSRLENTGQKTITHIDREYYTKVCKEYLKKYPKENKEGLSFKYFTLIKYLRHIFRTNRFEFYKWISDPKWIFPVDYAVEDFLNSGALSDVFRSSEYNDQGGYFKYSPEANIELVMMTRGVGKTTKWSAMRALQLTIRYPEYKWLVVSADKERAKSLLSSIKKMMFDTPYLALVFPDMFATNTQLFRARDGNVLTNEKIDVLTFNEETEEKLKDGTVNALFRKEATFTICSPGIDRTGWHFEGIIADDLVIDETSKTPEATAKLVRYFRSLFAMKQYRDGWQFKCYLTGTEWFVQSLYDEIKKMKNSSVFECPGKWLHDGKEVRLTRHFTDKFFEDAKDELGEWYPSQMFMKARSYEGAGLDLNFNVEHNVIEMTHDELDILKAENMVTQICDPSYTRNNKKAGDGKSRFTIMNAVVTDDNFYIYGGYQSFGEDNASIKSKNIVVAKKENIDFFIQDAQGTQGGLYDEQIVLMKEELPYLKDFKHDRRVLVGTPGKQAVANSVLQDLFLDRQLFVVTIKGDKDEERRKVIQECINQFLGLSAGLDIVDCTVYMVADIERDFDVRIARINKNKKKYKRKRLLSMSGKANRYNYGSAR